MNSAVKALPDGDVAAVRRDAEAEFARLLAEHPDDRECADRRAEHLRDEVPGNIPSKANLPVTARARVTAGLMWLPEMYPNV